MNPTIDRIKAYLSDVSVQWKTNAATEHSYRGALQSLLSDLIDGVTVVNEPAHIACGAPDLLVRTNAVTHAPVGYVETKDIDDGDLDGNGKNREQFDRYKADLDNLVFTDYLDFRFYLGGKDDSSPVEAVRIASLVGGNLVVAAGAELERFATLVGRFGAAKPKPITSPARLATLMAGKARLLARSIAATLAADAEGVTPLAQQMEIFRKMLIHDLTSEAFADIYAQTITYGLLAARLHDKSPENFSRAEAALLVPRTNPLLRKLFLDLANDLDPAVEWIVDDLVALFAASDVAAILKDYGKSTERTDPILHFYEDFLSAYNPALRKQRGVWYTPDPVVNFIVRAVDFILRTVFGLSNGIADYQKIPVSVKNDAAATKKDKPFVTREMHRVQLLDLSTGTGTFITAAIRLIHGKFSQMQGLWQGYVRDNLLSRLNGFEILMASYAMAHLKIEQLLASTGYVHDTNERLRIFLTNSLEEFDENTGTLWATALAQEAQEANYVKRDCPVMVVMGNPPYSGESQNKGESIMRLMEDYKKEPGGVEKLKERNPKWLNDDYVKFLRKAQSYIDRTGSGIVAFINPHGFLDNPTFRGMRWNLLKTFDEIYVLNLHGNAKKKETTPEGGKDENVFDIMQGVSINIFVKKGGKAKERSVGGASDKSELKLATVRYADIWGLRQDKYDFLETHTLDTVSYKEVEPTAPYYFFVPKNADGEEEYRKGFSLAELFSVNTVGIVTANDKVLVAATKEELRKQIESAFPGCYDERKVRKVDYRAYDERWLYYDVAKIERARAKIMYHMMIADNLALLSVRQLAGIDWYHISVTDKIVDDCRVSNKSRERGYVFPLYLYSENMGSLERRPNLNAEIVAKIEAVAGEVTPEDVFNYVYATLHTPAYREKYREFLKVDFPRVPYPASAEEFRRIAGVGAELVSVHLLKSPKLSDMFSNEATFPVAGSNYVDAVKFNDGRVSINGDQYFDNVPAAAWEAFIGGYQPAQKWLKDRKGRVLSADDVLHYKTIILALLETAKLTATL